MARLTDPVRLEHYCHVLELWGVTCYVHWTERAAQWVLENLPGMTLRGLAKLMHEHVKRGGEIDEVRETREEWRDIWDFHYDLRLRVPDGPLIYIETRLEMGRTPDDSTIWVVNVHEA